jgi:hypothetical protein
VTGFDCVAGPAVVTCGDVVDVDVTAGGVCDVWGWPCCCVIVVAGCGCVAAVPDVVVAAGGVCDVNAWAWLCDWPCCCCVCFPLSGRRATYNVYKEVIVQRSRKRPNKVVPAYLVLSELR